MRKKIALVRHYFPNASLKEIDDEDFAILANDAEWLFAEQTKLYASSMFGMASGASSKKQKKR